MKTNQTKQIRSFLASALLMTGAYVVANILGAHDAFADLATQNTSGGVGTVINNAQGNLKNAANLVYIAAYTGGVSALMMGAFKLKAHAENPSQTPMAHGLARLGVGAALIALPSVAQTGMQTLFGNDNSGNLTAGTINSVQVQN